MTELTPKEIVQELNRFVVGQYEAKRAVANALRNRWRRRFVPEDIRNEIIPHNILMIGPTGVGKTEIARRLSVLAKSPFIKVEATKFTEVGYVGRDVESIIRDLLDISIAQIRKKMHKECGIKAEEVAKNKLLDVLIGENASADTREKFREHLNTGRLDQKEVEIEILETKSNSGMHSVEFPGGQMGMFSIGDMLGKAMGQKKTKMVHTNVADALKKLTEEESNNLIDEDMLVQMAIQKVEEEGIVFLDEIDKITSRSEGASNDKGVSREGVQRDLLPLIEGGIVNTKHGPVRTNHILFIASGAFHFAKPSDLLPELQGRLPVRVRLQPLTEEDLVKILTEPEHNLPLQYQELLKVDHVGLEFTECGIKKIAAIATDMNARVENIGARRLHTIIEKLLEGISFTAPETPEAQIVIDKKYVESILNSFLSEYTDHTKFIL
jgi:ATP-dependent HslUV protease ATP-binding subunit HslU